MESQMQSQRFSQQIVAPARQAAFGPPARGHREDLTTPGSSALRQLSNAGEFFHQRSQSLKGSPDGRSFKKASPVEVDKFRMPTINKTLRGPNSRAKQEGAALGDLLSTNSEHRRAAPLAVKFEPNISIAESSERNH